jgi:hypothetical protein
MRSDLPIGRAHEYLQKVLLTKYSKKWELKSITLNYLVPKFGLLNVVYESKLFKLVGNLFQATAPLYENDFLQKFVFGFGGTKLNSACLVS